MRRREFIAALGAAAAKSAWPAPARAAIPRVGYFWSGFKEPNVGGAGLRLGVGSGQRHAGS